MKYINFKNCKIPTLFLQIFFLNKKCNGKQNNKQSKEKRKQNQMNVLFIAFNQSQVIESTISSVVFKLLCNKKIITVNNSK